MSESTLGDELVSAVKEALSDKESGLLVRTKVDIFAIRKKLHMTQKEFSKAYHINLETLRNWEQNKRTPDATSIAYLICIVQRPNMIRKLVKSIE